jgi:drug/metabolite transporter (DMT)-like permease
MKEREFRGNVCLVTAAFIWGFAFVAMRVGSQYVPALTFNAFRFLLGSVSLAPLAVILDVKKALPPEQRAREWKLSAKGGIICGVALFFGISLQQYGLTFTSAGKAGFITDMYIVLVPVAGLIMGHKIRPLTWGCILVCVVGLYLISVTGDFTISRGDAFVLMSAFVWTVHILLIDHFVRTGDPLKMSLVQFMVCSALSFLSAGVLERGASVDLMGALWPLLYSGILSAGVAFTLQIVGQRSAKPTVSALILSLESVFACIGGALILHESLGARGYFGCALMISGIILTQLISSRETQPQ